MMIKPGSSFFLKCWSTLQSGLPLPPRPIYFFNYSLQSIWGSDLTTPRSRVTCSAHWASQAPWDLDLLVSYSELSHCCLLFFLLPRWILLYWNIQEGFNKNVKWIIYHINAIELEKSQWLGILFKKFFLTHYLLFWHRLYYQVLLAPLERWLNPQQVWPPHLLLEVATRSMPTRWSAQIHGNRSLMPFCNPWARLCPVSLRPLFHKTGPMLPVAGLDSKMRKCLNSQSLLKRLPQIRAQRKMQQRGLQKHQRGEGPLSAWATPGMDLEGSAAFLCYSFLKPPLAWLGMNHLLLLSAWPALPPVGHCSALCTVCLWPWLESPPLSGLWDILKVHGSKCKLNTHQKKSKIYLLFLVGDFDNTSIAEVARENPKISRGFSIIPLKAASTPLRNNMFSWFNLWRPWGPGAGRESGRRWMAAVPVLSLPSPRHAAQAVRGPSAKPGSPGCCPFPSRLGMKVFVQDFASAWQLAPITPGLSGHQGLDELLDSSLVIAKSV